MLGPAGFFIAFGLAAAGSGTESQTQQDMYFRAADQCANATYIDTGLNKQVDEIAGRFERKYINKEFEKYGTITGIVAKAFIERRFVYTLTF